MASIRIVDVPDGEVPEEIRRAWVGLVLPLADGHPPKPKATHTFGVLSYRWKKWLPRRRAKYPVAENFIVPGIAAIQVLKKSDRYAAEWWIKNTPYFLQPSFGLGLQPHVCEFLD
jgi:hypothetical protein